MTTTYEYTPAGERSEIDYEDPATHDVSYRYDPDGRQTAMVDATGQAFSYDSLGRLTSVTDADAKTVRYGYDLADRQTTFAYPGAGEITRTYAAADRLLQNTTSHEYDGRRRRPGRSSDAPEGAPRRRSLPRSSGGS